MAKYYLALLSLVFSSSSMAAVTLEFEDVFADSFNVDTAPFVVDFTGKVWEEGGFRFEVVDASQQMRAAMYNPADGTNPGTDINFAGNATDDFIGFGNDVVLTVTRPDAQPFNLLSFRYGAVSGGGTTVGQDIILFQDPVSLASESTSNTAGAGDLHEVSPGFQAIDLSSLTFTRPGGSTGSGVGIDSLVFNVTAVPEPTSLSLLAIGAFGVVFRRRRI